MRWQGPGLGPLHLPLCPAPCLMFQLDFSSKPASSVPHYPTLTCCSPDRPWQRASPSCETFSPVSLESSPLLPHPSQCPLPSRRPPGQKGAPQADFELRPRVRSAAVGRAALLPSRPRGWCIWFGKWEASLSLGSELRNCPLACVRPLRGLLLLLTAAP